MYEGTRNFMLLCCPTLFFQAHYRPYYILSYGPIPTPAFPHLAGSGKLQRSRLLYSAVSIASPLPEQLTTHSHLSQSAPFLQAPHRRIQSATFAFAAIMRAFPTPAEQQPKAWYHIVSVGTYCKMAELHTRRGIVRYSPIFLGPVKYGASTSHDERPGTSLCWPPSPSK